MLKIRARLLILLFLFGGLVLYLLFQQFLDDVLPRYKETMEESMVDLSVLLAALVSSRITDDEIPVQDLKELFGAAYRETFSAQIYEMTKTRINMHVYVTDKKGIVLYDSDGGNAEGQDYSQWNDVHRTLQGEYGARSSRQDPDDPLSSLLCVAAPIKANGEIVGVLTVSKPAGSVRLFLEKAQEDIILLGVVAGAALFVIVLLTSFWVTWPIEKLTRYVRAVHAGKRAKIPRLGRNEIGSLGAAFEEMRVALEGKQYIEHYVQALTHQMKSPLSAIRGAAELLQEDLPEQQRARFTCNILSESARMQELIDRMLQLSALENCRELQHVETVNMADVLAKAAESLRPAFSRKEVDLELRVPESAPLMCDPFLIAQAVGNLMQNALDFSRAGSAVLVSGHAEKACFVIRVKDNGFGIPKYARDKIFDRFYSLQRPDTGKTGSGLGLAFVREIALLHGGDILVEDNPDGGVTATLTLSRAPGRATQ